VKEKSARIVSSDEERLILVDAEDNDTGFMSKAECHDGKGTLHRAFSIFLFNDQGHLLLQQRAAGKRLWPMYWSNSCCSHPREREAIAVAAARRLQDELQTDSDLEFVYKFIYQASFGELGSEHELCGDALCVDCGTGAGSCGDTRGFYAVVQTRVAAADD
jgi:isopentenyl-diphosphate delta-isomerase